MMEFRYYYGNQADQFSFIRIPRLMLTDPLFSPLSIQAKMLYGLLLDRMSVSMRNGWSDEKNRVYIIYQISEIQEDLGFSKKKAIDHLTELEEFGLVEKKRRGRGLPSVLYIKSFMSDALTERRSVETDTSVSEEKRARSTEIDTSTLSSDPMKSIENTGISQYDDWYRSAETDTSGTGSPSPRGAEIDASRGSQIAPLEVPKSTLLEVPESTPLKNYINNNYTNRIYTESNHISSEEAEDEMRGDEKTESVKEMIEENIACEELIRSNPLDGELVNSILEIIVEVLMIRSESMLIASANYPTELVQERFRRINTEHVQYVIDCFKANTTRIGNIKKYLMTALFNAPATMDSYYTAAVHHDMPYLAAQRIGDQSCS